MLRNVEIKAKILDIQKVISLAIQLSDSKGEEIPQHDVFYNAKNGRLKLRRCVKDDKATLIYYDRPDLDGPKLSEYNLLAMSSEQANTLDTILTKSLGAKGEVKKKRLLFMVGQTRVHIDSVEGLGDFMELEVVLRAEQTLADGQQIAKQIQQQLGVEDAHLLSGAYMDLILKL